MYNTWQHQRVADQTDNQKYFSQKWRQIWDRNEINIKKQHGDVFLVSRACCRLFPCLNIHPATITWRQDTFTAVWTKHTQNPVSIEKALLAVCSSKTTKALQKALFLKPKVILIMNPRSCLKHWSNLLKCRGTNASCNIYLKQSNPMLASWKHNASAFAAHIAELLKGCCSRTLRHGNRRLHNNNNPAVRVEQCTRCEETNKQERCVRSRKEGFTFNCMERLMIQNKENTIIESLRHVF